MYWAIGSQGLTWTHATCSCGCALTFSGSGVSCWANCRAYPELTLLDSGQGTLRRLRIQPAAGQRASLTITLDVAMSIQMGERELPAQPMPSVRTSLDLVAESIAEDGDITVSHVVTSADLADTEGIPAEAVAAGRQALARTVGLKGSMNSRCMV